MCPAESPTGHCHENLWTSRAPALRAVVAGHGKPLLDAARDPAINAGGVRARATDWPSAACRLRTRSTDRSALGHGADLTRRAAHRTGEASAVDCAAGRGSEAPTVSWATELLASGDGTPSAHAILVEAHLAVRIAGLRAEGRKCWAGRRLDDASTSTARAAASGACLRAPTRRPKGAAAGSRGAAARSTAATLYSCGAAARSGAAATVMTCSRAARSATDEPAAVRRGSGASARGGLVALSAPARDAQRQRSTGCERTQPSARRYVQVTPLEQPATLTIERGNTLKRTGPGHAPHDSVVALGRQTSHAGWLFFGMRNWFHDRGKSTLRAASPCPGRVFAQAWNLPDTSMKLRTVARL
jgi:hypothetical protein